MSNFNPRIELYGRRVTVYDEATILDIGYLDAILSPHDFVIDGVTFTVDSVDDFEVGDDGGINLYNAIMVDN